MSKCFQCSREICKDPAVCAGKTAASNGELTREQAAKLLARGISTNGKAYVDDADSILSRHLYASPIGTYSKTAVETLIEKVKRDRSSIR